MPARRLAFSLRHEPVVVPSAPAELELLADAGLFVEKPPWMVLKTAAFCLWLLAEWLLRSWLASILASCLRWETIGIAQATTVLELPACLCRVVVVPFVVFPLTWTSH